MRTYLNLGCGDRFDQEWTNVDYSSSNSVVLRHDLRRGIPFPDDQFDVLYHSHLLEHLPRGFALPFLRECYRAMKVGGIIRVVLPDLERIAGVYLKALQEAVRGNVQWQHNYEWIMLELYDQTVREKPGGEMSAYFVKEKIPNKEFVLERIGLEANRIMDNVMKKGSGNSAQQDRQLFFMKLGRRVYRFLREPVVLREWVIKRVLGREYELFQLGRFRRSGESHLWMYDRYSLSQLLRNSGFENPCLMNPTESQIPRWVNYHLDTEPDGTVYKPDSLYMEAVKP